MVGDTEVTIIWDKDGSEEKFRCWAASVSEGVLHCKMRMNDHRDNRHIPLERIREYRTREV